LDDFSEIRQKIIGLGEKSRRKSYYPELQSRMKDLELFHSILNEIEEIVLLIDGEKLTIHDSNKPAQTLLSKDNPRLAGCSILELINSEFQNKITSFQNGWRTHENFIIEINQDSQEKEIYEFSLSRKEFDHREYFLALGRNITQSVINQEARKESEERLNLALEGGGLGMWDLYLPEYRMVSNTSWQRMLGYPEKMESPSFEAWKQQINPAHRKQVQESLNAHLQGKTDHYIEEYQIMTSQGSWKWIQSRGKISARDEHGTPTRITGTHLDIQEMKELEEKISQAQRLDSIGRLSGGIAHDFNNILTAISLSSELCLNILHTEQHGDIEKELQMILDAAEKGADLTRQLLTFSKSQITRKEPVNINRIIRNIQTMAQRLLSADIQLTLNLSEEIPEIAADPTQMEQLVLNMLINARDAVSSVESGRSKKISISSSCTSDSVVIEIEDNGCGITEEGKKLIFDPFYTTKQTGKGTGLGLSTVYGIVRQCNGSISMESEIDRGTTFRIDFPIEQ